MKLTLLRHGITLGNARRLYYGSTDLPLLPQGLEALGKLRQTWTYPTGARYYTSGMRRTEETLLALYGPVNHGVLPGLREMDFGAFEMKSYEELKEDPAYQAWITGDFEANVCPGGESGVLVTRRALHALEPVLAAGQDTVCITHGGVIGGLLAHWFPGTGRYDWTPEPGRGFQVTFQAGQPVAAEPVPFPGSGRA
ncbi:MAG: histidine phosphatase family protein [Clostridiales bacterium]|nr:histidine phosphatase family protein [Clostridiales bacterium]